MKEEKDLKNLSKHNHISRLPKKQMLIAIALILMMTFSMFMAGTNFTDAAVTE